MQIKLSHTYDLIIKCLNSNVHCNTIKCDFLFASSDTTFCQVTSGNSVKYSVLWMPIC